MNNEIILAAQVLGIDLRQYLKPIRNVHEGQKYLEEFQKAVKQKHKEKALQLHPDVNPDVDVEEIKRVNAAKDVLMGVKPVLQQPKPPVIIVRSSYSVYGDASSTGTATGSFYF